MQKYSFNLRLTLVCLAAASVALPIALISIAKTLLLVLGALLVLLPSPAAEEARRQEQTLRRTFVAILIALLAFGTSLLWTTAPQAEALSALAKYGKLLMIPVIVLLVRSRREAMIALTVFAVGQAFLLLSSWLLFFHVPLLWAKSLIALKYYAPFSSYLDQGIMSAVFAAVCWHFRKTVPGRFGSRVAVGVSVLALLNVLFVLEGRSGHLVAIVLVSLIIMWALPRSFRMAVLVLPFLLLFALYTASPRVQDRLSQARTEVQKFSLNKGESLVVGTSSGIRLHMWHRALQSIAEHPLKGSGIGSWAHEFNRIEKVSQAVPQTIVGLGNPHQEYLLWGVQLGLPGLALFLVLMVAVLRDSFALEETASRAVQSVLAAFAVACLFNSSLFDALIGDFFCVTLGLLLAVGIHSPVGSQKTRIATAAA